MRNKIFAAFLILVGIQLLYSVHLFYGPQGDFSKPAFTGIMLGFAAVVELVAIGVVWGAISLHRYFDRKRLELPDDD